MAALKVLVATHDAEAQAGTLADERVAGEKDGSPTCANNNDKDKGTDRSDGNRVAGWKKKHGKEGAAPEETGKRDITGKNATANKAEELLGKGTVTYTLQAHAGRLEQAVESWRRAAAILRVTHGEAAPLVRQLLADLDGAELELRYGPGAPRRQFHDAAPARDGSAGSAGARSAARLSRTRSSAGAAASRTRSTASPTAAASSTASQPRSQTSATPTPASTTAGRSAATTARTATATTTNLARRSSPKPDSRRFPTSRRSRRRSD